MRFLIAVSKIGQANREQHADRQSVCHLLSDS